MQAASGEYKELMRRKWRNPLSHLRITIGMINQAAQASAYIQEPEQYTYYSDLTKPMDNYKVQELYVSCDQDYSTVDGSMYFLPREPDSVVLNQGIVTKELLGTIEIHFPIAYDIKGLTIEFGKAYPVDFSIMSDKHTVVVTGNASGQYVTEEIFESATYLKFVPKAMANGQSRFRINQITMGIGVYFDSKKILSATKKEHISPISEEIPTIDFGVTIDNQDRAYDIENEESSVNFLEVGQSIEALYGQALDDGTIEWIPGVTLYLKSWSADDEEMSFSASDRFDSMNGTYYLGDYHKDGISLYDCADDVLQDAGIDSRDYWLDPYLKTVRIYNPIPAVAHKEALQLIANAGRCILYQDREGKIYLKSSFIPDMEASSDNAAYFSNTEAILEKGEKGAYALTGQDYTVADSSVYFLPREGEEVGYLNVGYVSEAVADEEGVFAENPTVKIVLEAAYKCFGLTLQFGRNPPEETVIHAYNDGEEVEEYWISELTRETVINHEFPEFDSMVFEFVRGMPNNRVVLEKLVFGDSTDYHLEYGTELLKSPEGTQLSKVRELQVVRTLYGPSGKEAIELLRETVLVSESGERYTFYWSNASYDVTAELVEPEDGQNAVIVEHSAYFATVEFIGTGTMEIVFSGKEYTVNTAKVVRNLNTLGSQEAWENPLVSEISHAVDLAEWIGDYMMADREYDLSYRGEPRLEANDLAFLENKYVPDMLIRVTDHTLKYNGGLSGIMKARRDVSYVAEAKDRLAGQRPVQCRRLQSYQRKSE
nr:MAG TPA: hypothetical protein [Caudoviricetes sp.]